MPDITRELREVIRQNSKDHHASVAIEIALEKQQQRFNQLTHSLQELHRIATQPYEHISELYTAYLKLGCEVFSLPNGCISYVDEQSYTILAIESSNSKHGVGDVLPLDDTVCQAVVQQNKTLAYDHLSETSLVRDHPTLNGNGVEAYIATPIQVDGEIYGTISFYAPIVHARPFTDFEVTFIELMAQGVSKSLHEHFTSQQTQRIEQLYQQIFEKNQEIALLIDPESEYVIDANPAACQFYGYDRETFRSLRTADINALFPDDIEQEIRQARIEDRPYYRFPHRLSSGEIREVEVYPNLIHFEGRTLEFRIVYDITQRKQTEDALKKSEANLRSVFDNVSLGLLLLDEAGNIISINQAVNQLTERIWGRTLNEGDSIYDFGFETNKYTLSNHFQRALNGQDFIDERHIQVDGTDYYLQFRYNPVTTSDRYVIGVCLSVDDITEHKHAEQQLQKERNILRTLIDTIPDAIFIKDTESRYVLGNKHTAFIAGLPDVEDLVGKTDADLFPEYADLYGEDDAKILSGKTNKVEQEEPITYSNGVSAWHLTSKVPLRRDDDTITGLVGIARDITDRKQVQEELQRRDLILSAASIAAEQFLQSGNWHDAIMDVLELLGNATSVSRVYVFENDITDDGLRTTQRYEWVPDGITSEIDNPQLQQFDYVANGLERWVPQLGRGLPVYGHVRDFQQEEQAILLDQDIESIAIVPVFVGGEWWGFIGFDNCYDRREWSQTELDVLQTIASTLGSAIQRQQIISGLRDSEEKFTQLASHIPEIFWIQDIESTKVIYVSPAFEDVLGISAEGFYGDEGDFETLREIIHPEDRQVVLARFVDDYTTKPIDIEFRVLHAGGDIRWLRARTFPIEDPAGKIYRVAGVAQDVSDQKRAEQDSLALLAERERGRILANFVRDASHEFKTPLSIINTSTYLLEKTKDPDRASSHLTQIKKQADSLSELVEALIDMSRLDSQPNLTFTSLHINSVVRQVEGLIQDLLRDNPRQLTYDLDKTLPKTYAGMVEVCQALTKVVDNAVRYTEPDDTIVIRTYQEDNSLVIEVEDTGIGISEDDRIKIFNRFYRVDDAHSTRGFGLGLPIAKRIMELNNGTITVESTVGQGSRFKLILPIQDKPEPIPSLSVSGAYGD